MPGELILVFDCGSTNLRVAAVDPDGRLVAHFNRPNSPKQQPGGDKGWLIWDIDEIWLKLSSASRELMGSIDPESIEAVIVTTWGADGAPVKKDGTLTYPPISWQCPRTRRLAEEITETIPAWEIFKITGYQVIPFNTLLKLIWLRRNEPKALDEAYTWLMMPGLIVNRLTEEFHIEPTSASTMMAMDLKSRDWSDEMLELAELDASFFPEWREPGDVVGYITERASRKCKIPSGVPVIVGGHDTQFALIGSGAKPGEVVLSSGTWEILLLRTGEYRPNRIGFEEGMIIEADVQRGFWNPQLLMIGSAVLEWVRDRFFHELGGGEYAKMIQEAERVPPGSDGTIFIPSMVRESGPLRKFGTLGTILGLSLQTTRGQIYRAALEGLSYQLREALRIISEASTVKAEFIRVVGGGSKNRLWNRIRADVTGLPIVTQVQKEATALGAALIAMMGTGKYASIDEAQKVCVEEGRFKPGVNKELYEDLFKRFMKALEELKEYYTHQSA